jgi:hypothetical protein
MMAMESLATRLGRLILNPNLPPEDVPVGGNTLIKPRFRLQLPENFSAERHRERPPWVKPDYPDYDFESAVEIPYDIDPSDGKRHFIWIIYGSGGK